MYYKLVTKWVLFSLGFLVVLWIHLKRKILRQKIVCERRRDFEVAFLTKLVDTTAKI